MSKRPEKHGAPRVRALAAVLSAALAACSGGGAAGTLLDGGEGQPADLGPEARADLAPEIVCGDRICTEGAESCMSCPDDCGRCVCPPGFADCDGDAQNGCEANLNSPVSCGACGRRCLPAGGVNPCVLKGGTYGCSPTCDVNHADCDHDPDNGCEVELSSTSSCGACGRTCRNAHGAAACTTKGSGYFCAPTCDPGWATCGVADDGCDVQIASDVNRCGACDHACQIDHVTARGCVAGRCAPSCQAGWSDCTTPGPGKLDDGCETNGALDPGESDNLCADARTITVEEGLLVTRTDSRILPSGDSDTYRVDLVEGSHICSSLDQHYTAKVTLLAPEGTPLTLGLSTQGCSNSWSPVPSAVCLTWSGICGFTDDITVYLQVRGQSGASSCLPYALRVEYCPEGQPCQGC